MAAQHNLSQWTIILGNGAIIIIITLADIDLNENTRRLAQHYAV